MKLPASWEVPERMRERMGRRSAGRQRVIAEEGHLLLVLHRPPEAGARDREGVLFWRNAEGDWRSSAGGSGLGPLTKHVKAYSDWEDRLDEAYRLADDAQDYFSLLEAAGPLARAAANMHATLQAAREAVGTELIDLRDEAYDLSRSLKLLYDDARNKLDFDIARQAEEQARWSAQSVVTAHRLNALAAVFLPLTAFASALGMNLKSGLEDSPTWLFYAAFAAMVAVGMWVRRWALRQPAPSQ